MPGLLDFIVQDYQSGGYVNPFDQSAVPTQSDVLGQYDIDLTDDKYAPFIPTYDQTGEDFLRTNYMQDRQGLYGGARNTLSQLSQKSRETKGQQGFAGSGKSLLDTTRGDIVNQFGMDAQRMYTGLQQDIYGRRRDYGEDVLSAIGDLPDDAYTIGGERMVLPTTDEGDVYYNGELYKWFKPLIGEGRYVPVPSSGETTVEGGTVDPHDPSTQTEEGGVNINWTEAQASGFDFFTNTGQNIYLSDVNQYLVWDDNQNRYVEYTGG